MHEENKCTFISIYLRALFVFKTALTTYHFFLPIVIMVLFSCDLFVGCVFRQMEKMDLVLVLSNPNAKAIRWSCYFADKDQELVT